MADLNDLVAPQVFERDGSLWTPLSASELADVLAGTFQRIVDYAGGVPCRYYGPAPARTRAPLLICEGRCNRDIRNVDRVVAREYAQYGRLSDRSRALLRGLKHTPHEARGGGQFACLLCRRIRTCGEG